MNCYYHTGRQSVAQCVDCGKGLCSQCASKYTIPICDKCNDKRRFHETFQYAKPLLICIILYLIGYNIEILGPDQTLSGYILMSSYAGWKLINKLLPTFLVCFSLRSVFFYYLIKLCVSMIIGSLATPLYLIYCLYKLIMTWIR